jgi:predicted Zn-dependent protease
MLGDKLIAVYQSGDKKQEESLVKELEGYKNNREVTFSDDEKKKMEELAQRPEVKMIIEAVYLEHRAEDTEQAHRFYLAGQCFFYPNPMLQDYVNKLGQSMVPSGSERWYAFRIVQDPRPDAWALSTGSIYVTTGLVAMLDNEAQLAYVLAHEVGHVEHRHAYAQVRGVVLENLLEVEKEKSAKKKAAIIGAVAAGIGGVVGGAKGGGGGAVFGAALGFGGTALVSAIIERLRVPKFTDFSATQEADADEFAANTVLQRGFDIREAPKVFLTLQDSLHRDDRVGMGFHYGEANTLNERREHLQGLLTGALKADLDQRSKRGLQTSSPNFSLMMSSLKRDNGALAFSYDLFDEARQNLEEAIAVRSSDPRAHYYLGLVYKQTARNATDEQKAMDHFVKAIQYDTPRSFYPDAHLNRALALLTKNDPGVYTEAANEIKTFVEFYKLNHGGNVPGNMHIMYDYLSLMGESAWSDPPVLNVTQTTSTAPAEVVSAAAKRDVSKVKTK